MKRITLLLGLVLMFAAGTASAQTSVQLSLGFGVPRPYVSGDVFVGRPFLRPVYRPYFHHPYPFYRRPVPLFFGPPRRVIVVERGRGHRFERRDFDRDDRFRRDRDDRR
jgi:hypothetical protein